MTRNRLFWKIRNDYTIEAVSGAVNCAGSRFFSCTAMKIGLMVVFAVYLLREGLDHYDPERFLNYKMGCVLAMMDCLRGIRSLKRQIFSGPIPIIYRECPFDLPDAGGRPFLLKMWMSTKLCVGLLWPLQSIRSVWNRRQSRNMPRKTVVPRKPQQRIFGIGQTKSKPGSLLSDHSGRRTAKKPARKWAVE